MGRSPTMLRIRATQVGTLRGLRDDVLIPAVQAYVRRVEPTRVQHWDDAELRGAIVERLVASLELGLHHTWDRCRFVRYSVVYGAGFEAHCDWAAGLFARVDLDGTGRMNGVEFMHRNYLARAAALR